MRVGDVQDPVYPVYGLMLQAEGNLGLGDWNGSFTNGHVKALNPKALQTCRGPCRG